MSVSVRGACLGVLTVLLVTSESMAVPSSIVFLGELTGADDSGVNGLVDIEARLHADAAADAPFWPTPGGATPLFAFFDDVEVVGGVFRIELGGGDSSPAEPLDPSALAASGAWLELIIDDVALSPRLKLVSAPFALVAGRAEQIGDTPANEIATLDDLASVELPDGVVTADELAPVAFSGDYSDLVNAPDPSGGGTVPTEPCVGPNRALQWDGTQYICQQLSLVDIPALDVKGFPILDDFGNVWDGYQRSPAPWLEAQERCEASGARLPTASELYLVSGALSDDVANGTENDYHWSLTPWTPTNYTTVRLDSGQTTSVTPSFDRVYRCIWPQASGPGFTGSQCQGPGGEPCWSAVGGMGARNVDRWERPRLTALGAAHDCEYAGAHLIDQQELAMQITAGLPNGINDWLYVSDTASPTYVNMVRWDETDLDFTDYGSNTNRTTLTASRYSRCVGPAGPAAPNPNPPPSVFFAEKLRTYGDAFDRPAQSYATAVDECLALGGQLPTTAQLGELIRAGLPNGTNQYLWTADAVNSTANTIGRWSDVAPLWGYSSTERSSGTRNSSTGYAYRCIYPPLDPAMAEPTTCNIGLCSSLSNGSPVATERWMDLLARPPMPYIEAVKTCNAAGGRLASLRDYTEFLREGLLSGGLSWHWTSDQIQESVSYGDLVLRVRWTGDGTSFTAASTAETTSANKSPTTTYPFHCTWNNVRL